jgi:hypothetical protein
LAAAPVFGLKVQILKASGNMMKWREQLNGDCPRRDAQSISERCDLRCPDLPKVL